MIVLDTNVLSETMRPRPNLGVVAWVDSIPLSQLWTTSIVIAEISAGISVLPSGSRRDGLVHALGRLVDQFGERILPFTTTTAAHYGAVVAMRQRIGRPITVPDAQIAAITLDADAILATRNIADFEFCGVHLLNPWDAPPEPSTV